MNYTSIKKKKSLNEAALKRGKKHHLKFPEKQREHRFRRQLRDIFYKAT